MASTDDEQELAEAPITAPLAPFVARTRELDLLHRRRFSLARTLREGAASSWVFRWARTLFTAPRPSPMVGLAPPIPMVGPGECSVTFIGHATTLIRYARGRVLTDPCLAASLYSLGRARAPGLPPGALEALDMVLISHAHADHLHRASLLKIGRDERRAATLVVPAGSRGGAGLQFGRVVELSGASFSSGDVEVTAVSAQHRVGLLGGQRALGYVIRGDGPTVYFAGDTGYFSGFVDVGERFAPSVALLPISGYRPRLLRSDHLSPLDAIYAFEDLRAHLLVPIHHGAFPLGYEPLHEPLTWLQSLASARGLLDRVAALEPGASCVARRKELGLTQGPVVASTLPSGASPAKQGSPPGRDNP